MGHRNSYTIGFKLKVIAYYSEMELPNITHVANFFGLKRDNIKRWIWNKEYILSKVDEDRTNQQFDQFKNMRKITNGRKPILTPLNEKLICMELAKIRSDGTKVDNDMLKKKGLYYGAIQNLSGFLASNGWLRRFKKRHNIVYRRKSNNCLLSDEQKIEKARILDERIRMTMNESKGYLLKGIANMDQTNIQFGTVQDRSLDFKGNTEILIKKSRYEKLTCTIVLCCTCSGELLNPMVVFKEPKGEIGPIVSKKIIVPEDIIVTASKSGWTRNDEIEHWFEQVWKPGGYSTDHLLLIDSYACHTSKITTKYIADNGLTVRYLPSNCTHLFQPLDVTVNKVFKDKLKRHLYDNEQADTYGNNFRQAIIDAVAFAKNCISPKLIQKGFEKSTLAHYFNNSR